MSANPIETARASAPSQPVANDAWYLHSQGRQFGPLDEDEMRRYFRAGMVHAGDTIAIAGQHGTAPAAEVAALLGMPPPAPAVVLKHAPTTILVTETGASASGWWKLGAFAAIVAVFGVAYFKFVLPLRAQPEPQVLVVANEARSTAPVGAEQSQAEPGQAFAAAAPEDEASPFELAPSSEAAALPAPPQMTPVPAAVEPAAEVQPQPVARVPDEWRTEAIRLSEASQWAALEAHASKWTASQPGNDDAWWNLCMAHGKQGKWDRANEAFARALAVTPDRFQLRLMFATLQMTTNRFQESARILAELSAERPNHAGVWNDLGIAHSSLGEYDDAVADFEKAVKLDPNYRKAWRNLARSYAFFGHKEKAEAAFAKANGR